MFFDTYLKDTTKKCFRCKGKGFIMTKKTRNKKSIKKVCPICKGTKKITIGARGLTMDLSF